MTLLLSGTDGLSDVDGSAATPAIRGTDANTGIFFPAADTIAFSEGGAEVARFDSSGNLGIGATPSFGLTVVKDNGSGYVAGFRSAAGSPMLTIQNTGGISQIQGLNSALSAVADIGLQVSGGNVGIGTTSPGAPLQVNGTATAVRATSAQLWLSRTTSSTQYQGICLRSGPATDGFIGRAPNSDNIIFGFDAGASLATQMSLSNGGDLQFNSGYGSVATAYGCRAWANFNGTGTVAIRASGNVSSISDYGTGNYGVNYTTAMPNANYAVTAGYFLTTDTPQVLQVREYFTTYCTLIISQPGIANYDSAFVSVVVHR